MIKLEVHKLYLTQFLGHCKARESIDKLKKFIEKLFLHYNSYKIHSVMKPLVNANSKLSSSSFTKGASSE
ncbi:MAG: hypothetical protein K0R54_5625 [Clostridiaceae bacterium]|nr:hypothetical protein [Clostridiaceae bacterium]